MTLFPDAIDAMMGQSIMGRAQDRGYIKIVAHQIRDYTTNKQMQVDDYPYGGAGVLSCRRTPCTVAGSISARRQAIGSTPSTCRPAAGCLTSRWPRS